jgi:hypothetical protein
MLKKLYLTLTLLFFALPGFAQLKYSINGQYMNRAEYRHGYSTPAAADQDEAFFISQRARLMTNLTYGSVEIFVSIQDIRTWGSAPNLAIDNNGLLSVHEAWAALQLNKKFNLKVGRQEIAYDEDRIFGSLDWAMQARRHDAAILKFYDSASNITLHMGAAFNQNSEQLSGTVYTVPNNYKTFQYLYFSKSFGKVMSSFLFLNNGIQFDESKMAPAFDSAKTIFSQTFGPRFVFKDGSKKFSANAAFYFQTGKNNKDQSLSAYDFMAEAAYQFTNSFSLTAGIEVLSGTDELNTNPNKSKSFTPFYGTNHRFNGYMDYFFVNNHVNSVGLQDIYLKGLLKQAKIFYGIAWHMFRTAADVQDDSSPGEKASATLGSELDITINYNHSPGVSLQLGYSQMFATKTMDYLKNIVDGHKQTNNWGYVMLILRPAVAWPRTGLKI